MGKGKSAARRGGPPRAQIVPRRADVVPSLLDAIVDGREYESIVSKTPPEGSDVVVELKRALAEIEAIRQRPCIAYLGNVVKSDSPNAGVEQSDDLPFSEMVANVPKGDSVDVLLATGGGSGHQISRFVDCLRSRFSSVEFLVPSVCMSAGTLFALSGNRIWMTERACLGPIDPQVPTAGGRFVPAQALLLLVDDLQRQGEASRKGGGGVPWSLVRIIDTIDKKELGDAITASAYSSTMAREFLKKYKFAEWKVRKTSGQPVTDEYKTQRAAEIASALAAHDRWKAHGHGISREVLWQELKLEIDHPDAVLNRALLRAWALCYWVFDKTTLIKVFLSQNYTIVRMAVSAEGSP